jgi:glycine/D-amino acid oxidase-like deaminating enzyme
MKVKSGSPFWPIRDGLVATYPRLDRDLSSDVVVVGGGLSGAAIAYHLANAGVRTVVLDKRDIGSGSTSASTALVLYEVDTPLTELIRLRGEARAVRSYRACLRSIGSIEAVLRAMGNDCGYLRKESLYLATTAEQAERLGEEYAVRRDHGFRVEYLSRAQIARRFSFQRPAALLTHDAGQVDPFRLTHALLAPRRGRRLQVFDRTNVVEVRSTRRGVVLTTEDGPRVRAGKVVFATGFESRDFLPRKVVRLKSTYAVASEPVPRFRGWGQHECVIWEAARPYHYLRTTSDRRVIIGGADEDFVNPTERDRRIADKAQRLLRHARAMFPSMELQSAFAWAGTFGETVDSLPYIGEIPEVPNAYFALCFGGNGTNFAFLAGEILRDKILRRPNRESDLFGFDR